MTSASSVASPAGPVSATPPTPMLSVTVCPTARVRFCEWVWPSPVTSIRYVPGGKPAWLYLPLAELCKLRVMPVARLVAVTVGPSAAAEWGETGGGVVGGGGWGRAGGGGGSGRG